MSSVIYQHWIKNYALSYVPCKRCLLQITQEINNLTTQTKIIIISYWLFYHQLIPSTFHYIHNQQMLVMAQVRPIIVSAWKK